ELHLLLHQRTDPEKHESADQERDADAEQDRADPCHEHRIPLRRDGVHERLHRHSDEGAETDEERRGEEHPEGADRRSKTGGRKGSLIRRHGGIHGRSLSTGPCRAEATQLSPGPACSAAATAIAAPPWIAARSPACAASIVSPCPQRHELPLPELALHSGQRYPT